MKKKVGTSNLLHFLLDIKTNSTCSFLQCLSHYHLACWCFHLSNLKRGGSQVLINAHTAASVQSNVPSSAIADDTHLGEEDENQVINSSEAFWDRGSTRSTFKNINYNSGTCFPFFKLSLNPFYLLTSKQCVATTSKLARRADTSF